MHQLQIQRIKITAIGQRDKFKSKKGMQKWIKELTKKHPLPEAEDGEFVQYFMCDERNQMFDKEAVIQVEHTHIVPEAPKNITRHELSRRAKQ